MPRITLPDGSHRDYPGAVTVFDVAASIGAGLAKAALAGRVDGRVVDTSHLITTDASLAIITEKDADGLEIIRHSTAHLLAYAVKELFPEAQVTIGPVIENGFYYDFAYKRGFTLDDLATIETRMTELAKKDFPVTREVWQRDMADMELHIELRIEHPVGSVQAEWDLDQLLVPIGVVTRKTNNCSVSTVQPGRAKKRSPRICTCSKKPRSATIAN